MTENDMMERLRHEKADATSSRINRTRAGHPTGREQGIRQFSEAHSFLFRIRDSVPFVCLKTPDFSVLPLQKENLVRMMEEAGLVSAWHEAQGEEQGRESVPTFYLHRHLDRPYHIDYAFVAPQRLLSCTIAQDEAFACSDHRPLVLDLSM